MTATPPTWCGAASCSRPTAPRLCSPARALWALGILRAEPADVELLLPASRYVRPRGGVCVHTVADLAAVRSLSAQGLRIARTARSVADHARHAGITPLCRVIADAERLRHCTLRQIGDELDRRVRFPGRAVLRRAHGELTGELNHSGYERLGRDLLRRERVTRLRGLGSTAAPDAAPR